MSASTLAQAHEPTEGIVGLVVDIMEQLGAVGAGIAIFAENLFPPLPSELILPLAGFTVSQGNMSYTAAVAATTAGSLLGAWLLYAIGALLGRRRTRAIAHALPLVKLTDVDRTEAWFDKHGGKAVFFGRMIPIFRSLISIPAGIERMPLLRFSLYTAAGSLIWNTALITAGYLLGQSWYLVEQYVGIAAKLVAAAVVIAVAVFIVIRIRTNRRDKHRHHDNDDTPIVESHER